MKEESELQRLNRRLKSANACFPTCDEAAEALRKFYVPASRWSNPAKDAEVGKTAKPKN